LYTMFLLHYKISYWNLYGFCYLAVTIFNNDSGPSYMDFGHPFVSKCISLA